MTTPNLRLHAIEPGGLRALALPEGATTVHELLDGLELGVYSALHSFPRARFFRLEDHLDRTDASLRRLGWSDEVDRERLRGALHGLASDAEEDQVRFRFDVLAEPATRLDTYSRLLVGSEPHHPPPPALRERGVTVGIARDLGREEPQAKSAGWVVRRRPYPLGPPDEDDHLLLDREGRILEGTSSNIFFVRRGELITAGDGVLEGIVRKVVLELARELRLPVRFERLSVEAAGGCDEAFLTSSSRHILPIVGIERMPVGGGVPGPITLELSWRYEERAELEARPAVE